MKKSNKIFVGMDVHNANPGRSNISFYLTEKLH